MESQTKGYFIALWIGENNPDLFSWWIQFVLTIREEKGIHKKAAAIIQVLLKKKDMINYSHNAIYLPDCGKIWHATTGEKSGVIEENYEKVMIGSKVRFSQRIELNCTQREFLMWLRGEEGKDYSQRQNIAALFSFTRGFVRNGDRSRNCSEFVARACQFSANQDHRTAFERDFDFILPTDTFRVILPIKSI